MHVSSLLLFLGGSIHTGSCAIQNIWSINIYGVWPIYYNDWTAVNRNVANKYKYRQGTIYNIITKKYEYNRSSKQ